MACTAPRVARRDPSGGVVFVPRITWDAALEANRATPDSDQRYLFTPCGSCAGCRAAYAFEWCVRCRLEARGHVESLVTTLTYDEASVPVTLDKRHWQLFAKRLRKSLDGRRFRFFMCGEYGDEGGRPHFHALLFGLSAQRTWSAIEDAWSMGRCHTEPINDESIAYVTGYVAKKYGTPADRAEERVDRATGECYQYQPPFRLMSRGGRPRNGERVFGIGGAHSEFWREFRDRFHLDGEAVPAGRYLHGFYKRWASEDELAALQRERDEFMQRPRERSLREEYRVKSVIAEARERDTILRRYVS